MRFHLSPAALAAACLLTGTSAFAQRPPPAPRPPGPAIEAAAPASVITGRIERWLVNPNGDVDGLLLADGTQVSFPPHLSQDLLQTAKPGDTVRVSGWRAPDVPVVRASMLTSTATGRQVIDQPPLAGGPPPRPPEAGALGAMSASGRIARVLYTDRGDANGVLLDSGTIVRFPPHLGAALAPTLQPGKMLHARGWGSRSAQGSAIEATGLGDSAETVRDLFAEPGGPPPPAPAS